MRKPVRDAPRGTSGRGSSMDDTDDTGNDSALPTVDQRDLRRKLFELRSEHRDLDDVIAHLAATAPFDQLQRLKKRKLLLKDEISQLEDQLLPDIIA